MNYKEVSKIVNTKINRNELVEIFRYDIDEMSVLAQVCSLSQDLMCCRFASDFSFDGYKIFRNKDISEIVLCDKNENMNFISSVFRREKLFINEEFEFNTKSWQALLKDLMQAKKAISIECSFEDAIDYYVGWITKIENNIITVRCIDGSGYIFKDEIKVNSDFISAISVNDRYTEYMAKYARNL